MVKLFALKTENIILLVCRIPIVHSFMCSDSVNIVLSIEL